MDATYRQVFEHGLFHGDPHPGNLFVDADDQLVYLDFGLTGQLTAAMQDTLIAVFTAMVFRDAEALAMAVYRAGATKGRIDLKAFTEELDRNMTRYYGASLDDLANRTTFMEVVQLCTKYHITLPPEFAVLSRAITLVEGSVRTLLPGADIVAEVRPYAQRLMDRRFSPDRVAHDTARLMLQAQGHFRDIPNHLAQLMMDLQAGTITLVTRDPDAHKLREEVRAAVLRLSLAALGSTVTLGSLLVLAAWSPAPFGVPLFGPLALLGLGAGMGLFGALGLHVFLAGLVDLGAWRRRLVGFVRFFRLRRS
jgi:ubiquinone biosynthesis protein